MRKLLAPVLLILVMSFTVSDNKLTDEERRLGMTELTNSRDHLSIVLRGLSENQLNYRTSRDSWSIAECVEHITISEETFSGMLLELLKTDADMSNRKKVKISDKELIAMMKDRSTKVKTQKPFEPTGKYGSHEGALKAFTKARSKNIELVKTSKADFRNRVQSFPFGTVDAFQVVLFTAAHTERHVRQIEEIMVSAGFPKN
jgi:hypothetical protein